MAETSWLQFENNFTDDGDNVCTWSNTGATFDSDIKKLESYSVACTDANKFKGTGQNTKDISATSGSVAFWLYHNDAQSVWFFYDNIAASNNSKLGGVYQVGVNSFLSCGGKLSSSFTITNSTWYHFVITWASGSVKFYMNNSQIGETQIGATGTFTGEFGFGADSFGQHGHIWVDDFRYYVNRELTSTDIDKIYNSGNGTTEAVDNVIFSVTAALALSLTEPSHSAIVKPTPLSTSLVLSIRSPVIDSNVHDYNGTLALGPGGIGTRVIQSSYPVVKGTAIVSESQVGRIINLVASSSLVLSRNKKGIY